MAISSLLFGGISLWNARLPGRGEGEEALSQTTASEGLHQLGLLIEWHQSILVQATQYLQSIDGRTYVWLLSTLCLLILLAFATNPTEVSFRSYLTDVTLHHQLRHIHEENRSRQHDELNSVTNAEKARRSSPHVLAFSTRISMSLRTPAYQRYDYGLFSLVVVPVTTTVGDTAAAQTRAGIAGIRYMGMFGKWWKGGPVASMQKVETRSSPKLDKGSNSADWGVSSLQARDEDADNSHEAIDNEKAEDRSDMTNSGLEGNAAASSVSETLPLSSNKASGRKKKHPHRPKPSLPSSGQPPDSPTAEKKELDDEAKSPLKSLSTSIAESLKGNDGSSPASKTTLAIPMTDIAPTKDSQQEVTTQIDQIKAASEATRLQLQGQLDTLRQRKKDDDASRLDVKNRMKTLDESKRHAESVKREAERRLRAAKSAQDSSSDRIRSKNQEMLEWKDKVKAQEAQIIDSRERKVTRMSEIKADMTDKRRETLDADRVLEEIKNKILQLEEQLIGEEAKLDAAKEISRDRLAAMNQQYYAFDPEGQAMHSEFPHHQAYPLLSGPGESKPFDATLRQDIGRFDYNAGMATNDPGAYPAWVDSQASSGYPSRREAQDGEVDNLDETFDPTLSTSTDQWSPASFAPFGPSADELQHQGTIPTQTRSNGNMALPYTVPRSPFTSDLLPSNLFQNADDDERHDGVLPGSRSERIEAALNRFGLDNSDTSDVEAGRDGQDLDDGDEMDAGGKAGEGRQTEAEDGKSGPRNWWGGRIRSGSKERRMAVTPANTAANVNRNETDDTQPDSLNTLNSESTKRRSLSLFPRLSLNPGAKSFRGGVGKKTDTEMALNRSSEEATPPMTGWATVGGGDVPSGQDFESMKRAFQTKNLLPTDDEEDQSRRSWSAFDTWQQQQQQQFQRHQMTPSLLRDGDASSVRSFPRQFSPLYSQPNQHRSSSDTFPRHPSQYPVASGEGNVDRSLSTNDFDWSRDEVFLPLHKSRSNELVPSTLASRAQQRPSKASRFAFWNSSGGNHSPNVSLNETASATASGSAPSMSTTSSTSSTRNPAVDPLLAAEAAAEEGLGELETDKSFVAPVPATTPQPSKRSSFRWRGRQESNTDSRTAKE